MQEEEVVVEAWHVRVWRRYRGQWTQGEFLKSLAFSAGAFIVGVVANGYAITYATERASNPVTDIILSNTPVFDVDALAVWGAVALVAFITLLLLVRPRRAPFALYSLGLFFLIRAAFISMTHIGPFPDHTPITSTTNIGIYLSHVLIGEDDLFFSAHTGVPFLMALLFWPSRPLRAIFLVCSALFGIVMLLGHLHYTIDVASAFFITYSIYALALWLFPREAALLKGDFVEEPLP